MINYEEKTKEILYLGVKNLWKIIFSSSIIESLEIPSWGDFMRKVAIIGSGGAGKSTLARQLSKKLAIDVYHLDALFWQPNWVLSSREAQREIQSRLVKKESWIIDGNYGSTFDIRLTAADTIIFLDIHRVICLYRAFKRVIHYRNRTRPDMGEGCKERFDLEFFKWIWDFPKKRRPALIKILKELSAEKNIIILSSLREIITFIES